MKITSLVLLTSCLFLGCGDDDGDGNGGGTGGTTLANFVACGGDATGSWNYTVAERSDGVVVDDECPEDLPIEINSSSVSGTLELEAGMNYTENVKIGIGSTINYPPACIADDNLECSDIDDAITQCTGDRAVSCECVTMQEFEGEDGGTWSAEGNELTLQTALFEGPEGQITYEYCVAGDELALKIGDDQTEAEVLYILVKQ